MNNISRKWKGPRCFWQIASCAAREANLMQLATNSYSGNRRALRVGVDLISLIYDVHESDDMVQAPKEDIFGMFEEMSRFPVVWVFVVDGDLRCDEKRNLEGIERSEWTMEDIEAMILAFGWECHQAPAEAEGVLAALNRAGTLDFVVSSDSHIFGFGVNQLIQSPLDLKNWSLVDVYSNCVEGMVGSEALFEPGVELTWSRSLLLSLLLGNDYTIGLANCDIELAVAIAGEGDLADRLFNILREPTLRHRPEEPISRWRNDLFNTLVARGRPSLAAIAVNRKKPFPHLPVPNAHINPLLPVFASSPPPPSFFRVSPPFSVRLAQVLSGILKRSDLVAECRHHIWPGHVVRQLAEADTAQKLRIAEGLGSASVERILGFRPATSQLAQSVSEYRVLVNVSSVSDSTLQIEKQLTSHRVPSAGELDAIRHLRVWVPASILQKAAPRQVQEYCGGHFPNQ